jgi:hypothetical protein
MIRARAFGAGGDRAALLAQARQRALLKGGDHGVDGSQSRCDRAL